MLRKEVENMFSALGKILTRNKALTTPLQARRKGMYVAFIDYDKEKLEIHVFSMWALHVIPAMKLVEQMTGEKIVAEEAGKFPSF
jgi:hypothetical protein